MLFFIYVHQCNMNL